ncbi:MAG TPA: hypothetical protein VFE96_07530 [Candidatus Bathyarchaeia archaeon]|nr:hypothetical protein [Candidatus Bathyarchaeia archaeon]
MLPHTRSIGIIETQGMSNLIVKQSASSTRSRFYPGKERFADYIFTSPEVTVRSFKVLNEEVSDHLPLLMEFD